MMGVTRLYIEPRADIPAHQRPPQLVPVIDLAPETATALRKRLIHQGYEVLAVSI